MHPVLANAFRACLSELESIDTTTAQLHPEGRAHLPSIQQRVERNAAILQQGTQLLERRLIKGRLSRDNHRTRLEWLLQMMILGVGFIPQGSPMIDEELLLPVAFGVLNGKELAKRLSAELEAFDAVLDLCRKAFGMERVEVHPLLGPIRVDQWRRSEVIQLRSLLREVRSIRKSMERPVSQSAPQTARA